MSAEQSAPLVSILLVTANRADQLNPLIRSIEAQTMTNWELIAVDCASTDDTFQRLDAWQQKDSRVLVYATEETDRAIGRRQALKRVRGDYVAWVDPHTLWPPNFIEGLLASLQEQTERAGVVYSRAQVLDGEGNVVRTLPGEFRQKTMLQELFLGPQIPLTALLTHRRVLRPLEKTGMRFTLANDHALLLWLAHQTSFEPARENADPVRIYTIAGTLPLSLDPVSEERGEAMTYALENFRGAVPSRFARRCLAAFHCHRARALSIGGDSGEALSSALQALMYKPLWPAAWKQLLSVAVKG